MFICPQPYIWHEIYEKLQSAWETQTVRGKRPPRPLILSGWHYSNDWEKKERWEETVRWANENNLEHLIPEISAADSHEAENPEPQLIAMLGSLMNLPWDYTPKVAPSPEVVHKSLQSLKENWMQIAGQELGSATSPLRFSGRKMRRLLVSARPDFEPPWGTWSTLFAEPFRSHFREFRRAVNNAIRPHKVDHIDFEISDDL